MTQLRITAQNAFFSREKKRAGKQDDNSLKYLRLRLSPITEMWTILYTSNMLQNIYP